MLVNGIVWWDSVTLNQRHSEMEQNPTPKLSLEYHSDNGVQS